jgi:hypothetical protein
VSASLDDGGGSGDQASSPAFLPARSLNLTVSASSEGGGGDDGAPMDHFLAGLSAEDMRAAGLRSGDYVRVRTATRAARDSVCIAQRDASLSAGAVRLALTTRLNLR